MKTISVSEFRGNIKKYLDIAQEEKILIHRGKGKTYAIIPIDEIDENIILSEKQKKGIDEALESIAIGKIFSHQEAMEKIKSKYPKYFK
jgi:predicted transcriptional regulator